jgi:hypothetical protein
MNIATDFCLYFHINATKNEIFYVGIGGKRRPYKKTGRSKYWNNIVNKYNYIIDIVETGLTKDEAIEREKFYIAKIGRKDLNKGSLVNMTDGGEGGFGCTHKGNKQFRHTEESKKKIGIKSKGNTYAKGRVAWNKGLKIGKQSKETLLKRSLAMIGKNKKHTI